MADAMSALITEWITDGDLRGKNQNRPSPTNIVSIEIDRRKITKIGRARFRYSSIDSFQRGVLANKIIWMERSPDTTIQTKNLEEALKRAREFWARQIKQPSIINLKYGMIVDKNESCNQTNEFIPMKSTGYKMTITVDHPLHSLIEKGEGMAILPIQREASKDIENREVDYTQSLQSARSHRDQKNGSWSR